MAVPVQTMLLAGDIDMGHARALLAVDTATQIQLANQIIAKRLSVRDAEKLVTRAGVENTSKPAKRDASGSRDIARLEETLSDQLGTKLSLKAFKALSIREKYKLRTLKAKWCGKSRLATLTSLRNKGASSIQLSSTVPQ